MAVPSSLHRQMRQPRFQQPDLKEQMLSLTAKGGIIVMEQPTRKPSSKKGSKKSKRKMRGTGREEESTRSRSTAKTTPLERSPTLLSRRSQSCCTTAASCAGRRLRGQKDFHGWRALKREASICSLASASSLSAVSVASTSVAHDLAYRELQKQQARARKTIRERLHQSSQHQLQQPPASFQQISEEEQVFFTFPSTRASPDDCWAKPKFIDHSGRLYRKLSSSEEPASIRTRRKKKSTRSSQGKKYNREVMY